LKVERLFDPATTLDVGVSHLQHSIAVDGFYIYVTGGRRFFSNYGAYLGDLYFRSLDVRTNVWGKIVYQDSREFLQRLPL
jgi:hypothetical protein